MKKTILFSLTLMFVLISCKSSSNKKEDKTAAVQSSTERTNSNTTSQPTVDDDPSSVSFKVNGAEVGTAKMDRDKDNCLGLLTLSTKFLSISVYGATPGEPRRGWLNLKAEDYDKETGEIKKARASFVKYKDNAGNTECQYNTDKGSCTLVITKFELGPDGRQYLASGTFSAELKPGLGFDDDAKVKLITVTDGKFENVPVTAY